MLPVATHIHALVAEASGSFSLTHVLFAAQIRPVKPANKIMVDTAARGQVFYFHIAKAGFTACEKLDCVSSSAFGHPSGGLRR